MVVDDEADLREMLVDELAALGAQVISAENGRQAYTLYLNNKIDVIVCDVRMPSGDGVELLTRIRQAAPEAPPYFFVMTGYSNLEQNRMMDLGAQGFFAKPFNLTHLRSVISQCFIPSSA